jgi:hypothetical protein
MAGTIAVESRVGEGSIFHFFIYRKAAPGSTGRDYASLGQRPFIGRFGKQFEPQNAYHAIRILGRFGRTNVQPKRNSSRKASLLPACSPG